MKRATSRPTTTSMDAAGRLVIPKRIREAAGLAPGEPLAVRVDDGEVVLGRPELPIRIERRGKWHVAVPLARVPTLTEEEVSETITALRERRHER